MLVQGRLSTNTINSQLVMTLHEILIPAYRKSSSSNLGVYVTLIVLCSLSIQVAAYIDYNVSMPAQTFWRVDLLNADATDGNWHAVESQVRHVVMSFMFSCVDFVRKSLWLK